MFMNRFLLAASLFSLFALSACADDTTIHHRVPPKDPADYHGVPTDDRPPAMIDAPAAPK
ncbi:Lipoprotein (fragment) [Paraburkholderia piptadeniae]|uniref:Lipoprotein n=2 Tax=Paraburkholderia piptadeniae TaxID=1701573 RepID=A0A1N7RTE4_9BURK